MANTAAYNANEVAAVYMSLNRDDLLSSDEGGNKLSGDISLKNGFYGLSDPLNLRGVLESFEYEVASQNRSSYRVRILNPTSELETILMGFYSELFPSEESVFKTFKTASELEARMTFVEARTGNKSLDLVESWVPEMYLRFGYGTNAQSGLSRIHKCRVADIRYLVSEQADRVIELRAVDTFSYTKENPSFNKRQYVARTQAAYELSGSGKFALRKPSAILTEIFVDYLSTYPQCVPAVDLGSYSDSVDHLVFSLAKALAEADVLAKTNKQLEDMGVKKRPSEEVAATTLTEEEIKAFYDLLDRPLAAPTKTDKKAVGKVTPHILYQAFKMVFESIGMKWEMNPVGSPKPITGPLSPDQITDSNIDPSKSAEDQIGAAAPNYNVNIKKEWLEIAMQAQFTKVYSILQPEYNDPPQFRLSFWPLVLKSGKIRQLTQEEKDDPTINPIWLNAGMVNFPKNYEVGKYKNSDKNYKYAFPFDEFLEKYAQMLSGDTMRKIAEQKLGGTAVTLKPIPVSVPVNGNFLRAKLATSPEWNTLVGLQIDVTEAGFDRQYDQNFAKELRFCTPLIDMDPNASGSGRIAKALFRYDLYDLLPKDGKWKALRVWAEEANALETDALLGFGHTPAELRERALNPPLVLLEPTNETALWVYLNWQQAQAKISARKALEDAQTSQIIGGSSATDASATPPSAQKFSSFIDEHTSAYVSMGDDGQNPHITGFLTTTLNKLNRLLIGKSTKMRIESVQVNMLSVEDKKALSNKCTLFKDVTWDEVWAEKDNCLILAMPGDDMKRQYGDPVIRPILSFPQTYSEDAGAKYMCLDYGVPNSIIGKLDFTGDQRPLVNIAQSLFNVRHFNEVKQLFDGTTTLSKNILTKVISNALSEQIATLKAAPSPSSAAEATQRADRISKLEDQLKRLGDDKSDVEMDAELLTLLPTLIGSYQVETKNSKDELEEIITPNAAKQVRMLASLVANDKWLNLLFPHADIDGKDNTLTTQVLMVHKGTLEKKEIKKRILRRCVDLEGIRSRLGEKDRLDKMVDADYNYSIAMQQESFQLKITTLGIPEIDDPASEFLSRRVLFKYYDPRLANGAQHWLSGVYSIIGFKHRLSPSHGFITELTVVKQPKESLSNIKDTR